MDKTLRENDLSVWFNELQKVGKVIGAVRSGSTTAHAYISFGYVDKIKNVVLDYKTTTIAPKKLLMPNGEDLFAFKRNGEDIVLDDKVDLWNEKRILFGIHPCDITALLLLDKVFEEVFKDPYYKKRRENTAVIGLTCNDPVHTCFCNIVNSGPDVAKGYDLLMTDIGDRYYIKIGTESGEKLVTAGSFKRATAEDKRKRDSAIDQVARRLGNEFSTKGLTDTMNRKYHDEVWDAYSARCVTCGTCNMVCPTCHCFAVLDKTDIRFTEGKRIRVWDSCHFERFAKMAGGSDPRQAKSSRFKHRLYDKFCYTPVRYGEMFCVGCGRCIKFCQSEIDLRGAMKELQEGML